MKRFLVLLFATALSLTSLPGAEEPLKKLATVRDFAFGGVGVAGTTSQGELAFRKVAASKTGSADFARLLESGNTQARCYALAGLHALAPDLFAKQVKRFENDKTVVSTVSGCIIMEVAMSSVVASIAKGNYDRYVKQP